MSDWLTDSLLPLAIGVGATVIGGAILYFLFYRKQKSSSVELEESPLIVTGDRNTIIIGNPVIAGSPPYGPSTGLTVSNLHSASPSYVPNQPVNISGEVRDHEGNLVEAARVRIYATGSSLPWQSVGEALAGSDGRFYSQVTPPFVPGALSPVPIEFADVRLVGDDYPVNRSQLSPQSLMGSMTLRFQNGGNLLTSLFPIDWDNFATNNLRIVLELPNQDMRNIQPNEAITLTPSIHIESPIGIVNALSSVGGTANLMIRYRFTAPLGRQVQRQATVRVFLRD
jgi:hypothetical protein